MTYVSQNLNSANLLVIEMFDSGWKSYQEKGTLLFNQVSPERFDEKFGVAAAQNAITAVAPGDAYPMRSVEDLGSVTITQQAYKGSIPVNFLAKRFDNKGVILREANKQGYRAKITLDQIMANVLLGVESSTVTWDGLSGANAAHKIGTTGLTQSNIVTGALSEATVNSLDVLLSTQKDHANQTMPTVGKFLVLPKALAMKGMKLLKSSEGPETANREAGYLNDLSITPVIWPLLDATNKVDYHLIADKMFNRLEYCVSVLPTIRLERDTATGNDLYQIEFAAAAGMVDYLGFAFGNHA
jgi:hypothetical protein